ncbi:hypothetical protein [Exiguobacterium sp. s133]|uniref:hypothetical protein n=1 Tax=Exiguobacterium sp. s133 TaxID=2751213 RepID=UPI001BEAD8E8|nr:hypothetical protein [Exiguobacterium sp. s133]
MKRKVGIAILVVCFLAASFQVFGQYLYTTYIHEPADYAFKYDIKPRKPLGSPDLRGQPFPAGPMPHFVDVTFPKALASVGAIVTIGLLILLASMLKRKRNKRTVKQSGDTSFEEELNILQKPSTSPSNDTHSYQSNNVSEVRRLIQIFDQRLPASSRRRPEETMKEWLERIGLTVDSVLYHLVRYGEQDETLFKQADVDILRQQLRRHPGN